MNLWGQLKGIGVIGTGDFTHPKWFSELKEKLYPAEEGLFKLKPEIAKSISEEVFPACKSNVRFMLSAEISNIYKRHGKVRKVHNLIFAPSFESAEKINVQLDKIGNVKSDGRPILGLDSRDLLEIVLESDPMNCLIPAHIWTPWFSMMGSKSGFDSVEECFGDLTKHIFALETGLSSDPLMNWRLSQLDPYVLVSNGDAHSPSKLGREATIFDTQLSYQAIFNALKNPKEDCGLKGTIEFYPQEGKYHYDGHRACKMRLHPKETIENNGLCPVCKKEVTVGVMARVAELADYEEGRKSLNWRPFFSLVPLHEIIADAKGVGPNSKSVQEIYKRMLCKIGSEFYILLDAPINIIERSSGSLIAEGIRRVREREIDIAAGFDGEFGKIEIFSGREREEFKKKLVSI